MNVEVMDANSNTIVKATENISLKSMYRSSWIIDCKDKGRLVLEDRTKIKTNPMMKLIINNDIYYLKKRFRR